MRRFPFFILCFTISFSIGAGAFFIAQWLMTAEESQFEIAVRAPENAQQPTEFTDDEELTSIMRRLTRLSGCHPL